MKSDRRKVGEREEDREKDGAARGGREKREEEA